MNLSYTFCILTTAICSFLAGCGLHVSFWSLLQYLGMKVSSKPINLCWKFFEVKLLCVNEQNVVAMFVHKDIIPEHLTSMCSYLFILLI